MATDQNNDDVVNDDTDLVDSVDDAYDADNSGNVNSDLTAFSGQNPVKKITRYGLTSTARQLSRTYCCLFNGVKKTPEQTVYFGAPGTGKSYNIEKKLKKLRVQSKNITRVIFHPDYSYGDFVGSIRPKKDAFGIDYSFEPGPLTKAVRMAFENPHKEIYVIIEEINRGNAAAIFGDLFQLLDRDISGRSKYQITNTDMCSEICKNALLKPFFKDGKIWFPNNLNFLCTMNTADQNVFILDSAFKRRFHMEYVKIDFDKFYSDKKLASYLKQTDVFAGSKKLVDIYKSTELETFVSELDAAKKLERNWPTFALLVNKTIDIINKKEDDQISEDKKLGPFYVLEDEILEKSMFADKVIYYLKQDVFKYIDNYFNDSYQIIYDGFSDGRVDIFELLLPGEL